MNNDKLLKIQRTSTDINYTKMYTTPERNQLPIIKMTLAQKFKFLIICM